VKIRNEPSTELEDSSHQSYEGLHAELEPKLIAELLILLRSLNSVAAKLGVSFFGFLQKTILDSLFCFSGVQITALSIRDK